MEKDQNTTENWLQFIKFKSLSTPPCLPLMLSLVSGSATMETTLKTLKILVPSTYLYYRGRVQRGFFLNLWIEKKLRLFDFNHIWLKSQKANFYTPSVHSELLGERLGWYWHLREQGCLYTPLEGEVIGERWRRWKWKSSFNLYLKLKINRVIVPSWFLKTLKHVWR